MKVYFIYQKLENLTPTLYGFTRDKKLVKEFKEQRKMKYYSIVEKDLSEHEFKDFQKDHRGIEISRGYFISYEDTGFSYKRVDIEIVCTFNEETESYINTDDVINYLYRYIIPEAEFFKEEILDALYTLEYFTIKTMHGSYSAFLDGLKMIPTDLQIDSFGYYVRKYGHLLKVKK